MFTIPLLTLGKLRDALIRNASLSDLSHSLMLSSEIIGFSQTPAVEMSAGVDSVAEASIR